VYQYFINLFTNEKIVFWPDLASAHYATDTLIQLKELKIEYVAKEENPPNVPQTRPIENFKISKLLHGKYQKRTEVY
jgi:hypothetical protein